MFLVLHSALLLVWYTELTDSLSHLSTHFQVFLFQVFRRDRGDFAMGCMYAIELTIPFIQFRHLLYKVRRNWKFILKSLFLPSETNNWKIYIAVVHVAIHWRFDFRPLSVITTVVCHESMMGNLLCTRICLLDATCEVISFEKYDFHSHHCYYLNCL